MSSNMSHHIVKEYQTGYGQQNISHRWRAFQVFASHYDSIRSLPPPTTALDLGCGPGNITQSLRNFPNIKRVYGLDASVERVQQARSNTTDPAISYHIANASDITTFPSEVAKACDLVISFSTLHWVPDVEAAFRNIRACLKPQTTSMFVGTIVTKGCFDNDPEVTTIDRMLKVFDLPRWSHLRKAATSVQSLSSLAWRTSNDYSALLESCGFHIISNTTPVFRTAMLDDEFRGQLNIMFSEVMHLLQADEENAFIEDCIALLGGRQSTGLIPAYSKLAVIHAVYKS